ncbi:hypothetical protein F3Y22_tig00111022pilonHSYRG00413 [Hibiscus syriacus]|uniref:Aminotransferase-like plant mobile domain-containing protein n=1 Tax=Hibiscus syriacus TaxID=106335 RepID=A0A6A2Z798_HIBSY|nr:hypothetical protein F3Y22_tig00111022pilonHSYRG00413 [Hibiscus syriacus]
MLRLDGNHISSHNADTENNHILDPFIRNLKLAIPTRVWPYLVEAGFDHIARYEGHYKIEPNLIYALVERWRPETHTFHLPCGECTITLEDVSMHLGIPMDGDVILGMAIAGDRRVIDARQIVQPSSLYVVATFWRLSSGRITEMSPSAAVLGMVSFALFISYCEEPVRISATIEDLLPQNRPNQGYGTQEGLELKSFKLGLHWFCLDQSSLLKVSLSWSLFFVLAVGSPIFSHFLLLCSDCVKQHQRPYNALLQLSLSSFAAISFDKKKSSDHKPPVSLISFVVTGLGHCKSVLCFALDSPNHYLCQYLRGWRTCEFMHLSTVRAPCSAAVFKVLPSFHIKKYEPR